jgi:hypothetical protein
MERQAAATTHSALSMTLHAGMSSDFLNGTCADTCETMSKQCLIMLTKNGIDPQCIITQCFAGAVPRARTFVSRHEGKHRRLPPAISQTSCKPLQHAQRGPAGRQASHAAHLNRALALHGTLMHTAARRQASNNPGAPGPRARAARQPHTHSGVSAGKRKRAWTARSRCTAGSPSSWCVASRAMLATSATGEPSSAVISGSASVRAASSAPP